MKQKLSFTFILLIFIAVLGVYSFRSGERNSSIPYTESLDEIVAVINGENLTLRDMAFYIAYEENEVEEDAFIYNPKNTREYWSLHTNGTYVITEAKKAAMDMAVHDAVLYQLAVKEGVELDEAELKYLKNSQEDFWSDLDDIQKEALGVGREVLDENLRKAAFAEKYQYLLAEMEGKDFEDYSFSGSAYLELEKEQEIEIREDIWDRVKFGNITVGSGIK